MDIKVLDSSAVIRDPSCYKRFGVASVCIPLTVLEELDNIKSKANEAAVSARKFFREFDQHVTGDIIAYPGVRIGDGWVYVGRCDGSEISECALDSSKPDNAILATCIAAGRDNPDCTVTLVTEDRALRIKAKFFGLESHGVPAVDHGVSSVQYVDDFPEWAIQELFAATEGLTPAVVGLQVEDGQRLVLRNGSMSAMVVVRNGVLVRVRKKDAFGVSPRNVEQSFAMDALLDPLVPLVALTGKAGTGKTLLALAAAIEQRALYRQILMARPIVPLGNDIGFLPGEIKDKIRPYMQPFFDNLAVIRRGFKESSDQYHLVGKLVEQEKLIMEPLVYIRGRSLPKVFLIVDEAQNLTAREIKAIVTRAGEGTKVILTGDLRQIDTMGLDSETSGLGYLINKLSGQSVFAHIELEKGERSELSEVAALLL